MFNKDTSKVVVKAVIAIIVRDFNNTIDDTLSICEHTEVLVASRNKDEIFIGGVEFPGGKLEANENSYEALCRELSEELDLVVEKAHVFRHVVHEYDTKVVDLTFYIVYKYSGYIHGKEGQSIRWITIGSLGKLDFPIANEPAIQDLHQKLRVCTCECDI